MSVARQLPRRIGGDILPFFEPCLPRPAARPPCGPEWLHEIKHDGFPILAYRQGNTVRLLTRKGYDLADRFTAAVLAIKALPVGSCVIDGEAIACEENGLSNFEMIRWRRHGNRVVLCAFDILYLDDEDLRGHPIEQRKSVLAQLLRRAPNGIVLSQIFYGDGAVIYQNACRLGCEGIISKRRGSIYRGGRSASWLKVKNPAAPAFKREAEEDWKR
jgi:bifunctional non-homologous end joining protein LigD